MTTNVSSDLTKYKLLLTDTGQADNATGVWQREQAGTWGKLTVGGPGHEGNWFGANGTVWDVRGKWGRLRHEGNWLGPTKNGAQCPKLLYSAGCKKGEAGRLHINVGPPFSTSCRPALLYNLLAHPFLQQACPPCCIVRLPAENSCFSTGNTVLQPARPSV